MIGIQGHEPAIGYATQADHEPHLQTKQQRVNTWYFLVP